MLIYVGYLAIRISRHLRVPVVTSFLLLGVVAGPQALNLVDSSAIATLRVIEPIALGMIAFAAGEQLFLGDLRVLSRQSYVVVGLETTLPILLVGVGVLLLTRKMEMALPLAAIAGTTGLATVMSTLRESGAKGDYAKLLGFSIASDNVFAVLVFTLVLPLAVALETGGAIGHLYADRLVGMVASVATGCVAGILVAFLIRKVRTSHELLMLVLAHVLVVVGVVEYLGFSVLLAGLAMGTCAANLTKGVRDRERVFSALMTLEYPVIAIFFIWAGAGLQVQALGDIGLLFAVYVGARLLGKLAGPLLAARVLRKDRAQSQRFVSLGMSLIPQAGAAVGLGLVARDMLPENGETILAAVLASVVVVELVGPLGVHWAARHAGEVRKTADDEPLTLTEAVKVLQERRACIVVLLSPDGHPWSLDMPRLLAVRLSADLLLVPVSDAAMPSAAPWSSADEGESVCRQDVSSIAGCRETVLGTVWVDSHVADRLVSLLAERAPAVILLAPIGLPGFVLEVTDELSRRLGCPVFRIPELRRRRIGLFLRARRLVDGFGRSRPLDGSVAAWRRRVRWMAGGTREEESS